MTGATGTGGKVGGTAMGCTAGGGAAATGGIIGGAGIGGTAGSGNGAPKLVSGL